MRFSVRARTQNALFCRVRFSSPAQTWSHLTQRRILRRRSHVKAQSAPVTSRKGALRATARMQSAPFDEAHTQNALFRHVAAPGRCGATPPPGCGALWRMPQLGKCARATPRQAAGRLARGSADLGLESGLTERCTLPNRWASECAFPCGTAHKMRFSVASPAQNASFRRVRFSSPAQTWSHLTQRRILRRRSHVKAQSVPVTSRKGALRATARMQSAPLARYRLPCKRGAGRRPGAFLC